MQEFIATPNKIKQKTLLDQLKCHLHNKTSCLIKGQRLNNAIKTVLWRLWYLISVPVIWDFSPWQVTTHGFLVLLAMDASGKNLGLKRVGSTPCSCKEISVDGAALGLAYGNFFFVACQHFSFLTVSNFTLYYNFLLTGGSLLGFCHIRITQRYQICCR